jgi:hypothetical protein
LHRLGIRCIWPLPTGAKAPFSTSEALPIRGAEAWIFSLAKNCRRERLQTIFEVQIVPWNDITLDSFKIQQLGEN